jgi:hypothetical protein
VFLYVFHLIVIIYSMLVLFIIYIFQFDEVPRYFKQVLHVDDAFLSSIGFEKFDKKDELVLRLLTPTTFLIVNILQVCSSVHTPVHLEYIFHYFYISHISIISHRFTILTSPGSN